MKKTLYSLMLNDDVVREVDVLAHRLGTNRSNLVNRILAEYVGMDTPEQRINDIFRHVEQLLSGDRELVPYISPNATSLSVKSSLQFRYRPTVKYSVELYRDHRAALGELSVLFRTQSAELLSAMESFFQTITEIETSLLTPLLPVPVTYTLSDGRFTRSIVLDTKRAGSSTEIANALSAYVRLFDGLMKASLAGADEAALAGQYTRWIRAGNTVL